MAHFSQFISEKVKKNVRKSQAQFLEKLRKLRLRQNDGFPIKRTCMCSSSYGSRYTAHSLVVFYGYILSLNLIIMLITLES